MNESCPDRQEPDAVNSPEELGRMLDEYYALHEWDRETSWPTKTTLEKLDLADVAAELNTMGKLVDR